MPYPKKVKVPVRITVTLDKNQYDTIMELAEKQHKAFADIVRLIIDEYLKNHNLIAQ
uniref:Hypothetical CopG n=1 Tax=archaeon enrichment culture clone 1(2010) TaxID=795325 RepID=D9CGC5_9ARCH|nr:hypothetical CopG [archaeon enrichment culture clone 1(2010)]